MKKKKFFSYLFLGLLAVGATGTVTSCKDYDDDINGLRTDLTSLQSQLAALQKDYNDQKTTFQDAISKAQGAADAAQATADQAVKDAQTANALAQAADAAAAKAQAQADQNAIELGRQLNLINGKVDQTEFNDSVRSFVGQIASINEDLLTLANKDEVLNNAILANAAAIKDLDQQVTALNNFKEQIDALKLTTTYPTVLSDIEKAKSDILDIKADVLKKYNELKAEADEALATANTANATANTANATANSNKQLIQDLKVTVGNNTSAINELKTRMAKAEKAISAVDSTINAQVTEAKKELNARIDSTNANVALNTGSINTLNIYVTNSITSLVYNPDAWVFGFGAIPLFNFDDLNVYTVDSAKVSVDGETVNTAKETENISQQAVARYWMNPASANFKDYKYSFEELATTNQYTTRGHADTQKCNPEVLQDSVKEQGGVLYVPFTIKNPENVNNLTKVEGQEYKAWVTTIALRAHKTQNLTGTEKDADVVSDYAILDPTYSHELRLANIDFRADTCPTPKNSVKDYEIETVAKQAIQSLKNDSVSYTLAYNDQNGLDLKSKIEIHYNEDGVKTERKLTLADAEALGLTISFRPAKYALTEGGADETAASEVTITKDGVVTVSGKASAIGHTAMIAVELKKDGKNVAIGYITVKVATTGKFDFSEEYDNLYLNNCENDTAKTLLTNTVWTKASEQTGLTVDQLKAAYTLGNQQYVAKVINNVDTFAEAEGANKYGTITIQNTDPEKDEVVWSFSKKEIDRLFYANGTFTKDSLSKIKTVIRLTPNDANHTAIYVTLSIKDVTAPSAQVTIGPAEGLHQNGIKQYWYADGSVKAGSGWDEIHVNVAQPGNAGATDDKVFKSNLLTTFVGNTARATITDENFKNMSNVLKIYFNVAKYNAEKPTFVGTSGQKYNLTASKDTVYADSANVADEKVPVVVLSDGQANERFAEFQNNDVAKDILNKYAHRDGDVTNAFATYMILTDPADPNCFPLALSGKNTFNVRYLRPIDVASSNAAPFEDAAKAGYSDLKIADLFKFNDWRDIEFGSNGQNISWLNFYGIKALTPDLTKVQSNLNGIKQPLKDVTSLLKLTYTPGTAPATGSYTTWKDFEDAMGTIRYENLGATVGEFELYIPFTVEHNWGKIENVEITVPVKKSLSNAKKN